MAALGGEDAEAGAEGRLAEIERSVTEFALPDDLDVADDAATHGVDVED